MKSDTPETDAVLSQYAHHLPNWLATEIVGSVAKRLERERNDLRAAIRNLRDVKGRHHSEHAYNKLVAMLPESKGAEL